MHELLSQVSPYGRLARYFNAHLTKVTGSPKLAVLGVAAMFVFQAARAELLTETFFSRALGVEKSYAVYLPDGYHQSGAYYPVVYLLHGWGVTETYWSQRLGLEDAVGRAGLDAIVVMPDGDRSYYANSSSTVDYQGCLQGQGAKENPKEPRPEYCVRRLHYEDYITDDLVTHVDERYRTIRSRSARAISGESAGGFGAMSVAMRNPKVFSSVAAHSGFLSLLYEGPRPYEPGKASSRKSIDRASAPAPALAYFGTDIASWRAHDPVTLSANLQPGALRIYFDCGQEDEFGFHDDALHLHETLTSHGIEHEFHSVPGRHHDDLWRERIVYSLRFHAASFSLKGATAVKGPRSQTAPPSRD